MPGRLPHNHENPFQPGIYKVYHLFIPTAGPELDRALTCQHLKYPALLVGNIF